MRSQRLASATKARLARSIGRGAQGAALAEKLYLEGVRTPAELRRPDVLARLPRDSRANVLYPPSRNVPLATARAIVSELKRRFVFDVAEHEIIPVGSVRRMAPLVKDLDILVVVPGGPASRLGQVLASVSLRPARDNTGLTIVDTYLSGKRRRSLVLRRRGRYYHVDLFAFTQKEKPFALFHYTGGKTYNIRIRAVAKRKGWRLNQYGIFSAATGRRIRGSADIRTERELAGFLGVTYRLPTDRQ